VPEYLLEDISARFHDGHMQLIYINFHTSKFCHLLLHTLNGNGVHYGLVI